jgi:uncharacterized membrane protein
MTFEQIVPLNKIINHFKMDVRPIIHMFQNDYSPGMSRKRKIILIASAGLVNALIMGLHQTGIIKRLPDLPFKIFDANKVTITPKAFEMGLPDAPLASMAYSLIMTLATYGGKRNYRRLYVLDKLLFGLVSINALAGLQYAWNMVFKQKKICLYCVAAALINVAMIPSSYRQLTQAE